ncbi:MAG TPA: CdaR family protein [Chloroflexia bacterium]|nr:CdaR family protein [Chloroflexia bacterium]
MIVSIGLAVIVWGYVMATQFPERTSPPYEVNLVEPVPPPANLVMVPLPDQPTSVRVTVWGQADLVSTISPTQIRPYLDLSGYKQAGTYNVEVKLKPGSIPADLNSKIEPKTISVLLENHVEKSIPVKIVREGEVNPDYYLEGDIKASPSQVSVSGPESDVNQVNQAIVRVNLSNRVGNLGASLPVQLADNGGAPLPANNNLTVTPGVVNVSATINYKLGTRTVPVRVVTSGNPADGYIAGTAKSDPTLVTISSGDGDLLGKVNYVETEPVDISGSTSDVTRTVTLKPPQNVTVQGSSKVDVSIGIVPFQTSASVEVPVQYYNQSPDLRYIYNQNSITLTLSGPYQAFQPTLPLNKITAKVNLQNLQPGTHNIPVQVEKPDNLVVSNNPMITVVISRAPTPTPLPTLPPTSTPSPTSTPQGSQTPPAETGTTPVPRQVTPAPSPATTPAIGPVPPEGATGSPIAISTNQPEPSPQRPVPPTTHSKRLDAEQRSELVPVNSKTVTTQTWTV